jgi:hypothetical protein
VYLLRIANLEELQQLLSRIQVPQQGRRAKPLRVNVDQIPNMIQEKFPNCNPVIIRYIREAIGALKADLLPASAFLLGAASERAVSLLIDGYTEAIRDERHRQRFMERASKNKVISKRFDEFVQSYKSCKTQPCQYHSVRSLP